MPQIELRPIPLSETRPLRREVLRPHQTLDDLASHEPAGSIAFGAFDGDDLVAVGLVGREGDEPGDWRVRGMATKPRARGRGAGTRVLQALVQHAVTHGATRVWCNARTRARTLYEREGFVVASDEFNPPDIGPHYRMELPVAARR
jgi:GNAT superfamily N-acetyltransferase